MEGTVCFGLMLLTVLGLSTAQDQNCCSPDQWEGLITTTRAISEGEEILNYEISNLYYDYTNQRAAAFFNITDSSGQLLESFEALLLYSAPDTGVEYTLDLMTRRCAVNKVFDPFPKFCVPDQLKKVADFTLGAAKESLPVSLYEIKYKAPNETAQWSMTVTRNLCIPVSQLLSETDEQDALLAVTGYADIKLGISQPSVFTVPAECQSHTTLFAEKRSAKFPRWYYLASPNLRH